MGITIHYHGTIDDLNRIDELENRVIDLVFALGGRATVWRSFADHDPQRVVRGLIVDIAPGHDTFSLLVSPEGHLVPLFQIEAAEREPFLDPPACFVKTQFGSLQGHIGIVHLLDALREGFCSNLKVTDEGGYYETRDVTTLTEKRQLLSQAIESLADGLREHGLSHEAAEDPGIVASRIERIAQLVRRKLLGERGGLPIDESALPMSDGDVEGAGETAWDEPSLEGEVSAMDRYRRENQLRSERMNRRIQEATASGMTIEDAFRLAMRDEGLPIPSADADVDSAEDDVSGRSFPDEPWRESLDETSTFPGDDEEPFSRHEKHPAVEQAQAFLLDVMALAEERETVGEYASIACRGATDIVGGLVQATSCDLHSRTSRVLAITQLKRALTGHAFARGAVFALQSSDQLSQAEAAKLHDQLATLLTLIHDLASNAWDEAAFE
jgi:hypothetical protein